MNFKTAARPRRGVPAEKFVNPPLRDRHVAGGHSSPMRGLGAFCRINKNLKILFIFRFALRALRFHDFYFFFQINGEFFFGGDLDLGD